MFNGIAIDIALLQFLVTSINPVFQELLLKSNYFGNKFDEKVYINLRRSLGYANEIEKPSRNDSKLTVKIELKNALTHKKRLRVWG